MPIRIMFPNTLEGERFVVAAARVRSPAPVGRGLPSLNPWVATSTFPSACIARYLAAYNLW